MFADIFKDKLVYVPERKSWFVYDGKKWKNDVGDKMTAELCKTLANALPQYALTIDDENLRISYIKFAAKWQSRAYRQTVLQDASSVNCVSMTLFDSDPWLLNLPNGTIELRSGTFREHRASDYITKTAGANYDPEASCSRWLTFFDEIMSHDQSKGLFLQKVLGYSLTGCTEMEAFYILYGKTSRNGKSTLVEVVKSVLGDYAKTSRPETLAQRQSVNGSAPSEDLARLAGGRFVSVAEPDKSLVLSAALVKALTGNDSISCRFLHEGSFEYRPQFKIFLNTNYLPQISDMTIFASDRVYIVPFDRHFSEAERDTSLKSQFSQPRNLSAILNWLLDGLKLWQETGAAPPEAVKAATSLYKHDSDKIGNFIEDCLVRGQKLEVKTTVLYAAYCRWCIQNGYKESSNKTFLGDIRRAGLEVVRRRPKTGGEKSTIILGYGLLSELDEPPF